MAYIGKSPTGTGVRQRYYYTATGGETSLSGADDNSNTLVFSDGNYVDVSLNGIALVAVTDYNTSTANTIAGLSALSASDIVEIVVYDIFTVADTVSAKDGGTFSGNIAMGGTLSVTGESTATGGLNVGTIKEATGTTTAMTIDSTGRILTPARPAFRARLSSILTAVDYSSAKTKITFGTEDFDVGGNYDNANHKFVAPVTGYYFISYQIYYSAVTTATQITSSLYIDGVESTSFGTAADPQGGNVYTPQFSSVISLTAGEEVEVYSQVIGDNSVNVNTAGTFFSGFLVG